MTKTKNEVTISINRYSGNEIAEITFDLNNGKNVNAILDDLKNMVEYNARRFSPKNPWLIAILNPAHTKPMINLLRVLSILTNEQRMIIINTINEYLLQYSKNRQTDLETIFINDGHEGFFRLIEPYYYYHCRIVDAAIEMQKNNSQK